MKTFEASIFSLIIPNLTKKDILLCLIGYHFEFVLPWTGCSMKRAIDHENRPREILEKFPIILTRLTFLFIYFLTFFLMRNF